MSEEIRRCPFCWSKDASVVSKIYSYVWCSKCEAEGPVADNEEDAIEKWNIRRI